MEPKAISNCPYANSCGGCPWIHMDRETQNKNKLAALYESFKKALGPTSVSLRALENIQNRIMPGEGFSWRNRFQFHRCDAKNLKQAPVGLVGRDKSSIVPLLDCPIAQPEIRRALQTRQLLPPVSKNRFNVYAQDGLLLVEGINEGGKVNILDRKIQLDVKNFFQSNVIMLETLISDLLAYIPKLGQHQLALDLYSGIGTFSLFLKDFFPRLILMEAEKSSLKLAKENLAEHTAEYFALSDSQWAKNKRAQALCRHANLAILDPPRSGLSPALKNALGKTEIPALAYVSCNPNSQAFDIKDLEKYGYCLKSLYLYEFYPQSPHMESLAILERQ